MTAALRRAEPHRLTVIESAALWEDDFETALGKLIAEHEVCESPNEPSLRVAALRAAADRLEAADGREFYFNHAARKWVRIEREGA